MGNQKYSKDILAEAVAHSTSFAGVLKYLGLKQAGGTHSHIANKVREYDIDYSHFVSQAHRKGKQPLNKKSFEEVLVVRPEGTHRELASRLRRAMLEYGFTYECARKCGVVDSWNGKSITLEVNHIDGDWLNCTYGNVEFLCPNCHSQEITTNMPHRYRNRAPKEAREPVIHVCDKCGKPKSSGRVALCATCFDAKRSESVPSKSELEAEFQAQGLNYTRTGKSFGVSDNTIRKWRRKYGTL